VWVVLSKLLAYSLQLYRKNHLFRWKCDPICFSSRDISISGFGGHIAISSCRSLSQSRHRLEWTVRARHDRIPQICCQNFDLVFLGIKLFPVAVVILPFSVSIEVTVVRVAYSFFELAVVKDLDLPLEFHCYPIHVIFPER